RITVLFLRFGVPFFKINFLLSYQPRNKILNFMIKLLPDIKLNMSLNHQSVDIRHKTGGNFIISANKITAEKKILPMKSDQRQLIIKIIGRAQIADALTVGIMDISCG